jgi:hypothetical protein
MHYFRVLRTSMDLLAAFWDKEIGLKERGISKVYELDKY